MFDHGAVQLSPIHVADLAEVGEFLHVHLNARVTAAQWTASIVPTWSVSSPNHGFALRAEGRIVGVQLAFYAEREIDGRIEAFCNLGAWCVLEEYRGSGLRLLRAVLAQPGYHFTDLSPSGNVVELNRRLGFLHLDTTTALVPNRPLVRARNARILTLDTVAADLLTADEQRIHRDHQRARAAIHMILVRGDRHSYVIIRRDRRKGLRVFASVLYMSDPELVRDHLPLLGRHLLLRHGMVFSLVELRLLGDRPRASVLLSSPRPKMFRSNSLSVDACDNLYSELALVAW